MQCHNADKFINDYLDNQIKDSHKNELFAHIEQCEDCHKQFNAATQLAKNLRELPYPEPADVFFDHALKQASQNQPYRFWHATISSALVASLGLVFALTLLIQPITTGPSPSEFNLALQETRNIKLVFNAGSALAKAQLSLQLPEQIRVKGFPKKSSLSWKTQLKAGKNLLVLPVKAIRDGKGILTAKINHNGHKKTFKLNMNVNGLADLSTVTLQSFEA